MNAAQLHTHARRHNATHARTHARTHLVLANDDAEVARADGCPAPEELLKGEALELGQGLADGVVVVAHVELALLDLVHQRRPAQPPQLF